MIVHNSPCALLAVQIQNITIETTQQISWSGMSSMTGTMYLITGIPVSLKRINKINQKSN